MTTRPRPSTIGPPELPWRTRPRSDVMVRRTGPRPYASWETTVEVWPTRPGRTSYGPSSGKPRIAAEVPASAPVLNRSRGAPASPGTRSSARSLRASNQIASVSSRSPSPPTCTVVSSWPATTWAFVTTTPLPATQPLPCTPRPQAVPSTRTTLRPARRTSGSRAMAESGGGTFGAGPSISGNGSKRASACRIGPDGGRRSFSSLRIAERWIGSRSSLAPGVWSATAPAIHTRPRPRQPTSTAPATPSSTPSRSPRRWRRWKPSSSSPEARMPPISSAPIRANRGA